MPLLSASCFFIFGDPHAHTKPNHRLWQSRQNAGRRFSPTRAKRCFSRTRRANVRRNVHQHRLHPQQKTAGRRREAPRFSGCHASQKHADSQATRRQFRQARQHGKRANHPRPSPVSRRAQCDTAQRSRRANHPRRAHFHQHRRSV